VLAAKKQAPALPCSPNPDVPSSLLVTLQASSIIDVLTSHNILLQTSTIKPIIPKPRNKLAIRANVIATAPSPQSLLEQEQFGVDQSIEHMSFHHNLGYTKLHQSYLTLATHQPLKKGLSNDHKWNR